MGGIGTCCCIACDESCEGILAEEFDVDLDFDGTHVLHMANRNEAPACPSWYGYVCWSEASAIHSSCTIEEEPSEECDETTCVTCGEAVSDPTPRVWPGRPAWTEVKQSTHKKFSVARWDKTKYEAQLLIVPQGGTQYKLTLEIVYKHLMRFTLSSCVQYVYAIVTHDACPDFTTNSGGSYDPTGTCDVGSYVGYSAITLPAHVDPFENDEATVCAATANSGFPFSDEVNHDCPSLSLIEDDVSITPIATCSCCDGFGVGTWSLPSTSLVTATRGLICNSDLLRVFCEFTGGAGGLSCDEGLLVTQTLTYQSEMIECTDLCTDPIRLERIPIGAEANPAEDIPASTLEREDCDLSGCIINQDRPLIAKPAEIYVTLPCA